MQQQRRHLEIFTTNAWTIDTSKSLVFEKGIPGSAMQKMVVALL
jgi:hypothetical protein